MPNVAEMYPDPEIRRNRGYLGYDSSALSPRDRQASSSRHVALGRSCDLSTASVVSSHTGMHPFA